MGKLQVIVGGQYGSEGKGAIAGYLAQRTAKPLMAVRVAGPNAGHTVYDEDERRYAFRHIPVAAVVNPAAKLAIGPGSEIDTDVLWKEIDLCADRGFYLMDRLVIDPTATLIHDQHKQAESDLMFGTTGKGIGAARADRIMRKATLAYELEGVGGLHLADVPLMEMLALAHGSTVQIEGTQGYGLGLHAGDYPHCTSSDCRAIDFMAMAGVQPWSTHVGTLEIWVVLRTYPIRIAGNSGPMVGEMSWDELKTKTGGYVEPEYTTVTQKLRRVGMWDNELAKAALAANGGGQNKNVHVALTFADYVHPEISGLHEPGMISNRVRRWLDGVQNEIGCEIELIGTGPSSVVDFR